MDLSRDDSGHIKPTLILLGTRLGIDHVTPVYWDALKSTLQYPQSVGIAGYVMNIGLTRYTLEAVIDAACLGDARQHHIILLVSKDRIFSISILTTRDPPYHIAQSMNLTLKKSVILTIPSG